MKTHTEKTCAHTNKIKRHNIVDTTKAHPKPHKIKKESPRKQTVQRSSECIQTVFRDTVPHHSNTYTQKET